MKMQKVSNENVTTRIHPDFKEELIQIKKERIERGIDEKKKSDRAITKLITKHNYWENIKEDMIEEENGRLEE